MRPRIAAFAFVSALAWIACTAVARASGTAECATRVSPCINDDVLWPHAGPAHFVAVGSTETVAPGQLGFGLVTDYLSRPIILGLPPPGSGSSDAVINDQVNGTFLWSYGATDHLELDVALPITFGQGGTGLGPVTGGDGLHDTAERDLRFGFAYALVPAPRVDPDLPGALLPAKAARWGLAARFEMSAPTGDHDQFAGERSGVYVPSLAGELRTGRWRFGIEVGARLRPITELLGARVGTQMVTMAGAAFDILPRERLTASLEAWALPTLVSQGSGVGSPLVPAEWQLAARTAPLRGGDFAIQLGGGGAIPFGGEDEITRPRFRFTLGLRWEPLARDTDRAGVPDASDKCPTVAARGTPDGCPVVVEGPGSP
jgi:OOP family OmpA-OmpF porin